MAWNLNAIHETSRLNSKETTMSFKVVCPTCNTGYKLAKAPTKAAAAECKKCGGIITVSPPVEQSQEPEATPAAQTAPVMEDRKSEHPASSGQEPGLANKPPDSVQSPFSGAVGTIEDDENTLGTLIPAVVGGGLAAIVGGVMWGLIVKLTGYEIGYVAWAVGVAAGFGVLLFAGGRRGPALQVIAVIASILGIFLGKYFSFFEALRKVATEDYGVEAASQISMLSTKTISFFVSQIASMSSPYDILWIILAVGSAWRIPQWGRDEDEDED
jgi:hypothetical protein